MAGQHSEHIVFGAKQHACWLRCTLCEKTSRRVLYRYTICMKCPGRRRDDYEPLWETSTRCVLVKWNCLLLRLFWMGSEDTRTYFAQAIRNLRQRRQFVDIDDSENMEIFHEIHQQDPCNTQGSCPSKPFEGLEQCLPWHQRARAFVSRGYSWFRAMAAQELCPEKEDQAIGSMERDETERFYKLHQQNPHNTQGSCPSQPGIGLEQCQSWHGRAWNYTRRGYTWLWAKLIQEEYPSEGYFMNTMATPHKVEALQNRARANIRGNR